MESFDDFLKEKTILIVDDDVRNTFALSSYLKLISMKVYTTENGFETIDFLKDNPHVDVILMDMMMPEMDGYEAIERIRSNKSTGSIPIIAVTAKAMKGDREKCIEAGASEYVSKPVNMKELLGKIVQVLNLK
jgi:two-component system chemotaxis sensor kinase CheA